MAGYVSPTGNVANSWSNPTNAYDENTGSYATRNTYTETWSSYLELTHAALQCSKVRIWHNSSLSFFTSVTVDVYYGGSWVNIYAGVFAIGAYTEYSVGSTQSITAMRVCYYNAALTTKTASIAEADFYEEAVVTFIPWAIIM